MKHRLIVLAAAGTLGAALLMSGCSQSSDQSGGAAANGTSGTPAPLPNLGTDITKVPKAGGSNAASPPR